MSCAWKNHDCKIGAIVGMKIQTLLKKTFHQPKTILKFQIGGNFVYKKIRNFVVNCMKN